MLSFPDTPSSEGVFLYYAFTLLYLLANKFSEITFFISDENFFYSSFWVLNNTQILNYSNGLFFFFHFFSYKSVLNEMQLKKLNKTSVVV